jgi:hypothetical protein
MKVKQWINNSKKNRTCSSFNLIILLYFYDFRVLRFEYNINKSFLWTDRYLQFFFQFKFNDNRFEKINIRIFSFVTKVFDVNPTLTLRKIIRFHKNRYHSHVENLIMFDEDMITFQIKYMC